MSWLTDLYIFGKSIDRTERKMKEKNDQAARNLKRLYDAEKNFYEKQHIQKENERKEQAEEEKIKYLTTGIPEVIKKKNEAFFANYLNRFNALIEEENTRVSTKWQNANSNKEHDAASAKVINELSDDPEMVLQA